MIRTLIEVTAETEWEHKRNLESTLEQLGFVPRPSEQQANFKSDLFHALREKGIDAGKLVEEFQAKMMAERFKDLSA